MMGYFSQRYDVMDCLQCDRPVLETESEYADQCTECYRQELYSIEPEEVS